MPISTANQKVDLTKYGENYDRIDWGQKKPEEPGDKPKKKKGSRKRK